MGERTILITGATGGLGKGLAERLGPTGARLLLHGRNEAKGERLLEELGARATGELVWCPADFSSLDQVAVLADRVFVEERLDVLVNNAAIGTYEPGAGERMESEDGYELRFAVNYLAPFLLTRRLLPLLERSAPSRIVNVASGGQAPIDFEDVMLERGYRGGRAYSQSKLALIMFTLDLAEELSRNEVTANSLHPGTYMPTNMVKAAGVRPITPLEEGIEATLRLIENPELEGVTGRYFDGTEEAAAHPQAYDPEARRRLRELSEELTRVQAARSERDTASQVAVRSLGLTDVDQ
jgi:NAD(P)-dependent dehydrogenase (short-subunit alcohol dehydrogenase family)